VQIASIRCIARDGRQLAERHVGRNQAEVDTVDRSLFVTRFGRFLDAPDLRAAADNHVRLFEPARVTDHERTALLIDGVVSQALDDDFGTDAGGVAHRDADDRKIVAHDVLPESLIAFVLRTRSHEVPRSD
jgi:hypothetical protein